MDKVLEVIYMEFLVGQKFMTLGKLLEYSWGIFFRCNKPQEVVYLEGMGKRFSVNYM